MNRTARAFALTLAVMSGGLLAGAATTLRARAAGEDPYRSIEMLARALTWIELNHVDEHSTGELVHAAIRGMADSLDEHSRYFDPQTWRRMKRDHGGSYPGVGIEIEPGEPGLLVVTVVDQGPAGIAGIRRGDVVVQVDGQDITKLDFDLALDRIRGERGSRVTLGLRRAGQEDLVEVSLVREEVHIPSVHAGDLPGGVRYARVSRFSSGTSGELADALAGAPAAIVLDLRHDPGGLLEEAVATVDLFVSKGLIVRTEGRVPAARESDRATVSPGDILDSTLVVLVDEASASAAEIVAGALQDLGRATIVGQPSYGKGSVQTVFEFQDGGALKLTIGRYTLPSGRVLERDGGIRPDRVVPDPPRLAHQLPLAGRLELDPQLRAALEVARGQP